MPVMQRSFYIPNYSIHVNRTVHIHITITRCTPWGEVQSLHIYIYIYLFFCVYTLRISLCVLIEASSSKTHKEMPSPAALEAQGPTITLQKNRKKN